jgi:predicted permease
MLPAEALSRVAVAASLVALGAAARAAGGVTREDGGALLRVIFNVTLPAVLLTTFAALPLGGAGTGAATAAVVGVAVAQAAALGAASCVAWDAPSRPKRAAALLAGASLGNNLGLFAYPFCEAVWGAAGLQTVVLFDLANQGVLLIACYLAFWVRCRGTASGDAGGTSLGGAILRRLGNPCLVALYGAAALRCFGLALPAPLAALAAPLAAANKPLALLALGVLLEWRLPRGQLATVAAVLVRTRATRSACVCITHADLCVRRACGSASPSRWRPPRRRCCPECWQPPRWRLLRPR